MAEFGRIVTLTDGADLREDAVRAHYEQVKARHFPDWPGQPDINLGVPMSRIGGLVLYCASGWSADVPDEYVVTP